MAWIECHDTIWNHHKIYRLSSIINEPKFMVVGRLISLWHFVLQNAWRDSNLEPWGDDVIEQQSCWTGEKGVFVRALRDAGFLDGFVVHGWQKRAGRLVQDRRRNERRKHRRLTGGKTADGRRYTASKLAATLPNLTLPNLKKDKDIVDKPPTARPVLPTLEQVKAYCLERSNNVNAEKWFDHYQSNGWRVGKNPMKDWRAAVRTWEKSEYSTELKTREIVG